MLISHSVSAYALHNFQSLQTLCSSSKRKNNITQSLIVMFSNSDTEQGHYVCTAITVTARNLLQSVSFLVKHEQINMACNCLTAMAMHHITMHPFFKGTNGFFFHCRIYRFFVCMVASFLNWLSVKRSNTRVH